MKYALVTYELNWEQDFQQDTEQFIINIGNYVQWYALSKLYAYMGIAQQDIVRLSSQELATYRGEELILPINYMMCDGDICVYTTKDHQFIFSPDIKPVFLGLSIKHGAWKWTEERIAYLKKYEPIGCRDYLTWKTVSELGIQAYLAGCLTVTLPRREQSESADTVYFVEAPKSLQKYVPAEIMQKCAFVSQEIKISKEQFYDPDYGYQKTQELLDEYARYAKMVVTSRLHCALPCMAMGIPVLLAKEYFGYPFDLQKKFLPFYSYRNFKDIDWNPERPDFEAYKELARKCAAKRLRGENAAAEITELHRQYANLYEDGYAEEQMDLTYLFDQIDERFRGKNNLSYALWGISDNAEKIYAYMTQSYPQAKLVKVIDSFRKRDFHGIISQVPEVLRADDDFLLIVTTLNCNAAAVPFCRKIGKPETAYISVTEGIMEDCTYGGKKE